MRIIIACSMLLLAMPALSDDSAVYESIDDLAIGTVFLTPGERRWLDANRHLVPQDAASQSAESAEAEEDTEASQPAGFIINSSGQARRYRNGDFSLSSVAPDSMRFPDDVEIRRHVPEHAADSRDSDDEGSDNETVDD